MFDAGGLGMLTILFHVAVLELALTGSVSPLPTVVALPVELALSFAIALGIPFRISLGWRKSRRDLGTGTFAIDVPFSMEEMAFSFLTFALRFALQSVVGVVQIAQGIMHIVPGLRGITALVLDALYF